MRRRLVLSTLTVVVVVAMLLGLPLAIVETHSIEKNAQERVQDEAERLATAVGARLQQRRLVDPTWLDRQVTGDRRVSVLLPGESSPIVVGPEAGHDTIRAESAEARGQVVTVERPRAPVAADMRRAWLLVLAVALLAVAAAAGLAVFQARRLSAPLIELAVTAERLGSGDPRPGGRRYGLPELDRVADVLDASAERIARMLAAERQLAADASHQLRTPLTALSMRLEEIADTDDLATAREEASLALTQVERLNAVVERLLASARAPRGAAEPVEVDRVIRQQVDEWRPAYDAAGRRIDVTGIPGLRASATPGALAHVLATLFENALLHGEGVVGVRTRVMGTSVVVEVADEGTGVPTELGMRIFERSVSGHGGTGLGLAVARDLAEADGGRLELVRRRPPVFAVFLARTDQARPEDRG